MHMTIGREWLARSAHRCRLCHKSFQKLKWIRTVFLQVLWHGKEALVSAMKLIAAAELAANGQTPKVRPFVWRQSILRPAKRAKQASMTILVILQNFSLKCWGIQGETEEKASAVTEYASSRFETSSLRNK